MHGSIAARTVRLLRAPLDYALPPRCPACGVIVGEDRAFCATCWHALDRLGDGGCAHCRLPLGDAALPGDLCAPCLAKPPPHGAVYAATAYDRTSAAIALKLKYGQRIGLAGLMAREIARQLPPSSADWLLVPVPLHRWRLWRRGYNQALLIAEDLARLTGQGVLRDALVRTKATRPLGHMTPPQRRRALSGAFRIAPERQRAVAGRTLLLIDDVFTSGATAAACARALRRAGASSVHVACWARVVPGRADG